MKVRSIKCGQNIEILEQINNIPDGTEIIIDVEFLAKLREKFNLPFWSYTSIENCAIALMPLPVLSVIFSRF